MATGKATLILILASLSVIINGESDSDKAMNTAHIIASKFGLSQYAVEGMDYVISYHLYNVGDKVQF